jgi:succinyl-CoA synthetase beta subunit
MRLLEDEAKAALAAHGVPVPAGRAAGRGDDLAQVARDVLAEAGTAAEDPSASVVVKAMVATGRRGKSGFVRRCASGEVAAAADSMFGRELEGLAVERVYIEQAVAIASEYYLSFSFVDDALQVMASRLGGVEIEQTAHEHPQAVVSRGIDPLRGLRTWEARALWDAAGIPSAQVSPLADLTVKLFAAFTACDAQMLELNPIAITASGEPCVVGAMMEIDDNALFRHPAWEAAAAERSGPGGRALTAGERAVAEANRKYPGGASRYIELDGDIGLLVSGGGAGLYQHDLILQLGGRPANHTDFSPTPTPDKQVALLDAILARSNVRSLLVSCNYLQLARCDIIVEAVAIALQRHAIDTRRFPVVIRLFGPKEEEARAIAARFPGVQYLPAGTTLAQACQAIVEATAASHP